MPSIYPRRTVFEIRRKPHLSFYGQLDAVGQNILNRPGFEKWRWLREPLKLILFDQDSAQLIGIENSRIVVVSDSTEQETQLGAIKWASELALLAADQLQWNDFKRVGVRLWFALAVGSRNEDVLIRKMLDKYFCYKTLSDAMKMNVTDFYHVTEYADKAEPRKSSRIEFGAMPKEQWVPRLGYDPARQLNLTAEHISKIHESLPIAFMYVDLDQRFSETNQTQPLSKSTVESFVNQVVEDRFYSVATQFLRDIE